MSIIKRLITSVGEDVEKSEYSSIAGGNTSGADALGNSLAVPQKLEHRVIICDG